MSLRSKPALLARVVIAVLMLVELAIVVKGPDAAKAKREIAAAKVAGDATSHWEPTADIGIHHAAALNLGMLLVLALTAGWWTRPFVAALEEDPLLRERAPFWQRLMLPVMLVVGFTSFYGMMSFGSKSLWWDEMWAVKNCVVGSWKTDKKNADELKFQPTTWKRCAFYYQKPTNHAPMSLAQKASLSVWRKFTGASPDQFSEVAVRMPAFLASGLAVLLLMRLCGIARGASIGALLLMLHPWHLRYGVEARAYAFIVPLCVSAILAERKILFARGRTVWPWVWLGVNQALWIWTYPNAVLDVLVLFIVLGVFLWRDETEKRDRVTAMIRLFVTHVGAAMLWIQLFLPNLLQALQWAGKEEQGHQLDARILKDTLAYLAFGTEWVGAGAETPESKGLTSLVGMCGNEWLAGVLVALALGLSGLGLVQLIKRHPRTGWLVVSPLISSVLYAGIGAVFGIYFYPRFVIALLPVFVVGLSVSGWLFSDFTQVQRRIVMSVMLVFTFVTMAQRTVYMTTAYSGFKGAAEFVKHHEAAKPPLVICYGLGREVISVYLRDAQPAASAQEVTDAKAHAQQEGRELLVVQGYTNFNRVRSPDGMKLLDDRSQFEELGAWPGIEPDFFFRVLKAK